MTVTMHIVGMEALLVKLQTVAPAIARQAMAAGLYQEGQAILTDSQDEVPVELGVLKASGHVEPPSAAGDIEVRIGYGGAASAYAVIQHERTDFNHPNGGKSHYLVDPVLEHAPGMAESVGRIAGPIIEAGLSV